MEQCAEREGDETQQNKTKAKGDKSEESFTVTNLPSTPANSSHREPLPTERNPTARGDPGSSRVRFILCQHRGMAAGDRSRIREKEISVVRAFGSPVGGVQMYTV